MNLRIALAAAALVAAAGSANAATIMQSQSYGPNTPNFGSVTTFNQFNPALGTLLSVKVKVDLQINGGFLQLDNDGNDPAAGSAELGAKTNITSTDVSLLNAIAQPVIPAPGVQASNSSPFAIAGNDGDAVDETNPGTVDWFDFQGAPALDMEMGFVGSLFWGFGVGYIGVGTYDINVQTDQVFEYGAIGGINFAGGPVTASGTVMVTYEYEPIPAPGAAALLGLGGLLAARRRR